ncbi:MAG: hypothetical protein MUF54_04350 [Polyangiaceae bacterium]|nr:hypothetical protein [Polyangiaceae bacterium]
MVAPVRTLLEDTGWVFRKTDTYFLSVARFVGRPMQWQPFAFVQTEMDKLWDLAGSGEGPGQPRPGVLAPRSVRARFRRSISLEVRRLRVNLASEDIDRLADRLTVILDEVLAGTASVDDITAGRAAERAVTASSHAFAEYLISKPAAGRAEDDRKGMLKRIFDENVALQKTQT